MTIRTSSLTGGGALRFAADLTWPSDKSSSANTYKTITAIDGSLGLVTALSLTGKFSVAALGFENMVNENYTVKLTVDGVVIWNDTVSVTTGDLWLLGPASSAITNTGHDGVYICNSSLLLEIQSTTDTSVDLNYITRPIA